MTVILYCLSGATFLTLLAAFTAGLLFQHDHTNLAFYLHFFLGLFAVSLTLAVHCLVFIYFLGTGRWVKEVAQAYRIPDAPLPKLTRELKRWTFPVALTAMLVAIATAAAGAGAQLQEWPWTIHFSLALITLLVNLWAFWVELRNVRINSGLLDEVMVEVERIRAEQGLNSNTEALRQAERREE